MYAGNLIGIYFLSAWFIACVSVDPHLIQNNRFTVKVDQAYVEKTKQKLDDNKFSFLYEITPETFIVEYRGKGKGSRSLKALADDYRNQIIKWDGIRVFIDTLKPADFNSRTLNSPPPNLVCENYYGLDVEDVWKSGCSGKGVNVAITDVGVNIELLDLKNNINTSLSYNFVHESNDVTPETFPGNFLTETVELHTDHGNKVASVVAAEKDNNICSAGIAYNATIAVYKIYSVLESKDQQSFSLEPVHWSSSSIIARAFVHQLDFIDIFVNSWSSIQTFDNLDLATSETLKRGATQGRRALGVLYVVPAGPAGNGISHSIYTITVGGVSAFGKLPREAPIDSSIITSGLTDGNNITSVSMVTTSRNNKCISSFKGLSAATAQVGAIIALGLEANQNLSQRDILHLLVEASERTHLDRRIEFQRNGAGHYVHEKLGFGLLNAKKFVGLAKRGINTPRVVVKKLTRLETRQPDELTTEVDFCCYCKGFPGEDCISSLEYVTVSIDFKTNTKHVKIEIISPSDTISVLADNAYDRSDETNGNFVSVHFWDESSVGSWKVRIRRLFKTDVINVNDIKILLYGTLRKEINHLNVNPECYVRSLELRTVLDKNLDENKNDRNVPSSTVFIAIPISVCMIVIFVTTTTAIVLVLRKRICISVSLTNNTNDTPTSHVRVILGRQPSVTVTVSEEESSTGQVTVSRKRHSLTFRTISTNNNSTTEKIEPTTHAADIDDINDLQSSMSEKNDTFLASVDENETADESDGLLTTNQANIIQSDARLKSETDKCEITAEVDIMPHNEFCKNRSHHPLNHERNETDTTDTLLKADDCNIDYSNTDNESESDEDVLSNTEEPFFTRL